MFVRILRFNLHPDIEEEVYLRWDRDEMVAALKPFGLLEYRSLLSRVAGSNKPRCCIIHVWESKEAFQAFSSTGQIKLIFESLANRYPSIPKDAKLMAHLFPGFEADEYVLGYSYSSASGEEFMLEALERG